MLLSKVKNFNMRFRQKKAIEDASVEYLPEYRDLWEGVVQSRQVESDPRRTNDFLELDCIATDFDRSFPDWLKMSVTSDKVDAHLYAAHMVPHVCVSFSKDSI
jgi:hypothetical protein